MLKHIKENLDAIDKNREVTFYTTKGNYHIQKSLLISRSGYSILRLLHVEEDEIFAVRYYEENASSDSRSILQSTFLSLQIKNQKPC